RIALGFHHPFGLLRLGHHIAIDQVTQADQNPAHDQAEAQSQQAVDAAESAAAHGFGYRVGKHAQNDQYDHENDHGGGDVGDHRFGDDLLAVLAGGGEQFL